ncbi:MAG: helix-turn-helix transcriptional regulator [Vallitaleaceae bacterium]|nr:helix-turn-helix transcriptional regulator [Vallitaleaceae bacterium]
MLYELKHIGYNYIEDNTFIIDRPYGSGNYLFLFFVTPVNILINGQIVKTRPGAIVLFEPNCPQYYSNTTDGFTNDWFHLVSDDLAFFITTLNLPMNQLFYVDHDQFIRAFMRNLELEYKMKELAYAQNIHAQLTSFFIQLARGYQLQDSYTINPYLTDLKEQFKAIRSQILTTYQKPWNLEEMAELAGLSRSRFCVLYKSFFEISPKEDLLGERFNMAKHLLLTTQLSVQEVSAKVGYTNMYHFNKQFKKIVGLPPGLFRQ